MTSYIVRDGFKLSYQIEGDGNPTIVIGSALYYSRIFSQNLRQHLKFAFINHRGFGSTDKSTTQADFKLDKLVDDIEAFRQHLEFDKVIIIGHSGHGYMALEYAKKYADHVSHVILIGMGIDQSLQSHQAAQSYFDDEASEARKLQFQNDMEGLPEAILSDPHNRFITFCLRLGARSWYDATFDGHVLVGRCHCEHANV